MTARKSIVLAQNFIKKPSLIRDLLDASSICAGDVVYEIGPGHGIITQELSIRAKKVIAIEKDVMLYARLKRILRGRKNIVLHHVDFMDFRIQESDYKVFSNIPFNITSAIVKKLLYAEKPPREAYLIMQKEAAEKFIGVPFTSQLSVLIKPWFEFKITRMLRRTEFTPVPAVDPVMVHIEKRRTSLLLPEDAPAYERFVKLGFNAWKKNLKQNYKTVFSYAQWKRLSRDLHFPFHARPSELNLYQWLGLFGCYSKLRGTACKNRQTGPGF